jgi:hypothetical protein
MDWLRRDPTFPFYASLIRNQDGVPNTARLFDMAIPIAKLAYHPNSN